MSTKKLSISDTLRDKLFNWTRQSTLQEAVLDAEAKKGLYRRYHVSKIKLYKPTNILDYYNAYLDDDLIRAMVDDLTESALGSGYYNVKSEDTKKTKSEKAKILVDDFGKKFHLDAYMPNVIRNTLIAGFCPVETVLQKGSKADKFEDCKLKIIRPDTIDRNEGKGIKADTSTFPPKILEVDQFVDGKANTIKSGDNTSIAWFTYAQLGNDVRGVSFVRGVLKLLNVLNEATADVQKILDRYIAPIGVWKSEQNTTALKTAVTGREAGDDIYLGGLTVEEMASGVVEFHSIDPRVPFWDYLQYLDRRIWNYSRASNLYYMRNATQASADILADIIDRHVTAIQRFGKRGMENCWYVPLLKLFLGDNVGLPTVKFGVEKTGVEDIQLEGFLAKGIEKDFITSEMYFAILRQLGVDVTVTLADDKAKNKAVQTTKPPKKPAPTEEAKMFYLSRCMDCGGTVKQSVVWEKKKTGQAFYAWFCDDCLSEWVTKREKNGDKIISIKEVKNGKASEQLASYYSGSEALALQKEAMPRHEPGTTMKLVGQISADIIDVSHEHENRNPLHIKREDNL